MNVNFPVISNFRPNFGLLKNKKVDNSVSTNPIKYNKELQKDEVSFTSLPDSSSAYKGDASQKLSKCLDEKNKLEKTIADLDKKFARVKNQYDRRRLSEQEYLEKTLDYSEQKTQIQENLDRIQEQINEIENFINRPNAAFLYDESYNDAQKKEELISRPEFLSFDDMKNEIDENISWFNISGFFMVDKMPKGVRNIPYVDVLYPKNKENFNTLKNVISDSIPMNKFMQEYDLHEITLKELIKDGILETATAKNAYSGEEEPIIDYIPKEPKEALDKKAQELKKVMPKITQYTLIPSFEIHDKPNYVPITYLESIGYGSAKDLAQYYIKGYLKGKHKIVNENGKKILYLDIDTSPLLQRERLATIRKYNKSVASINTLAKRMNVEPAEIKRAIMRGDLTSINDALFRDEEDGIVIDVTNPKNKEYLEKMSQKASDSKGE